MHTACVAQLLRARRAAIADGRARDLPGLVDLLARGLLAGLGARLAPFLARLADDVRDHGTFATTTHVLRRLIFLRGGRGPLAAPETLDLKGTTVAAHARLVHLCGDLPAMGGEEATPILDALRVLAETAQAGETVGLDRVPLHEALDRVADRMTDPILQGGVLAVCVQTGLRPPETLTRAVRGRLRGTALDQAARIDVLHGILAAAPRLLWQAEGLLDAVDAFLCDLPEDAFLDLLPHLRLAFAALNPHEADRLARDLGSRHGVSAGILREAPDLAPQDIAQARALEAAMMAQAEADGIVDWLIGAAP